jgi:hypothetical protein
MKYSPFWALLIAAAALPAAEFSTYIGDEHTWDIRKVIVDASGNTYVAGSRSFNFSQDPLRPDNRSEAIVAKLDGNGKRVLLIGIGGKGTDVGNAVAVDRSGNIYLAGSTTSPNFPVRNALYSEAPANPAGIFTTPGFLTKLAPDGSIVYSTYFPAAISSIAVDGDGAAYVAGTTFRPDFPTTAGLPKGPASFNGPPLISGAFLTKVAPSGERIVYSTLISGQRKNCTGGSSCFLAGRGASASAVALDAAGNAYLAGNSDVTDLPTTLGVLFQTGVGAWVAKVNAAGTALAYLTYFGEHPPDIGPISTPSIAARGLAVDGSGNVLLAGSRWSGSPWRPDPYALKLNATGTAVIWNSTVRVEGEEEATTATVDAGGNFWVAGWTRSAGFPNTDGWSSGEDFVVRFDPQGEVRYSARYPTGTVRQSIAAGALLHTAGPRGVVSAVAASARPAVRPWTVGPLGGQVAPGEVIEIKGPHIGGPGAQVFIDDVPTQILYSGDEQINTIVPFEIGGRKTVRVRVNNGPEFVAGVLPAIPQIFVAVNQDGTVNSAENPARVGSIMTAWVTGSGFPENPGRLYGGGNLVETLYAAGYQINFVAPRSGPLVLVSGRYASPPHEIYVVD